MIDRHHLFYERGWYVSQLDKKFRSHLGFVAVTERSIHNTLHAVLKPPIKPSPDVMRRTLAMLEPYKPIPEDNVPRTAEFLFKLSEQTDDELASIRLTRIGSHLLAQDNILFRGDDGQSTLDR